MFPTHRDVYAAMLLLFEIVQECGETFEGLLLLVLDFEFKLDLSLADAADVGDVVKGCCETDTLTGKNRLSELHLIHSVVDEHLDVVHLNNLLPQMREEGKGEIAVSDGGLVGTFHLRTLGVNMYPLVVKRGIGKEVDTLLRDFEPFALTYHLAQMGGKLVV